MIKKTLATLAFLVLASPALAVCPTPLTGKDAAGANQNFLISVDPSGNCVSTLIHALISSSSLASWTSATAGNTNIDIPLSGNVPNVVVTLDNTAVTTGAVTIRGLKANGSYENVGVSQIVNHSTFGNLTNPYTLPTGGATGVLAQDFLVGTQGYKSLNVQLSTAITGAGTLAVSYTLVPYPAVNWSLLNPLVGPLPPLAASEAHVGEIGSNQIKVQVAQTVTAASAYTSGNAIGGKMTIAGAARVSGALGAAGTGGILTGMQMNSKSLQTTQVDVFLFDADPSGSTCTDKTAFVLATADFDKVVGILTIPGTAANGAGWFGGGTGSVGIPSYFPVTYDLSSATSLFGCAVTRGTPTFTATTDVSFKFNLLRN